MKKTRALWVALSLVFVAIFNTVFFVAGGFDHKASVWISYGFIHFAYLMVLVTIFLIRRDNSASVFGFSLYSVSVAYFLIEFVTGVVFILASPDSYEAALLVQLCIAGIYGIALLVNLLANEHTADTAKRRQSQIEYVKQASYEVKGLLDGIRDKEARAKVERVYDAIFSSPINSHPNLAQAELQILMLINSLKRAQCDGEKAQIASIADDLLTSINERNRQAKMLN